MAQEPNRNRKPEPFEPFFQTPKEQPEPSEPFFQEPKPEPGPSLSVETVYSNGKTLSREELSEPKTGTARTFPYMNRNRTEPGTPCKMVKCNPRCSNGMSGKSTLWSNRLKLSENFERHWSIPISGTIHMDDPIRPYLFLGKLVWTNGPESSSKKFPPTLVLVHGWLFPVCDFRGPRMGGQIRRG